MTKTEVDNLESGDILFIPKYEKYLQVREAMMNGRGEAVEKHWVIRMFDPIIGRTVNGGEIKSIYDLSFWNTLRTITREEAAVLQL